MLITLADLYLRLHVLILYAEPARGAQRCVVIRRHGHPTPRQHAGPNIAVRRTGILFTRFRNFHFGRFKQSFSSSFLSVIIATLSLYPSHFLLSTSLDLRVEQLENYLLR